LFVINIKIEKRYVDIKMEEKRMAEIDFLSHNRMVIDLESRRRDRKAVRRQRKAWLSLSLTVILKI